MRTSWIVWWATFVHLSLAFLLLYNGDVKSVSPAFANTVVRDPTLSAFVLMAASALATAGLVTKFDNRLMSWLFFLPQQFILTLTLLTSAEILINAEYQGRAIERDMALAVLIPSMIAALCHTVAVVWYHAEPIRLWWLHWRLR